MLEELHTFMHRINASYSIAMPRLNSYLRSLNTGVERLIARNERFTSNPIPSNGIDYINSLITRADIPYLLKYSGNDMDRLSKVNHEYKTATYGDFIRQYPIRPKSFIYSKKSSTVEYILITDDFDIIQNIPLGSDDFNQWLRVRPIQMLSNDSPELLLDITASRLKYRRSPPKEVVFSINVMKLLMVYTKYRIMYSDQFSVKIDNYPFIYKVCLLPLLYDNVKTWLIKIIYDMVMLKKKDPDAIFDTGSLTLGEKSTFALSGRHSAIIELEDIISKCAKGTVKPDEVIVSVCASMGTNLYDETRWLMNSHYVGNHGVQFRWAEFLREYFLLTTIVALYGLQPDSNRTSELRKLFNIVTRRLGNTRFWSGIGNPYLAEGIREKFDTLLEML